MNYSVTDAGTYEYVLDEFINSVMNCLPEYSLGYNTSGVTYKEMRKKIRESAKTAIKISDVVTIKKYFDDKVPEDCWDKNILSAYKNKGIFSEIVLHFILKEFKDTRPLNSKIFFKDSPSVEAHGFDAVHVKNDTLWLGETKFYSRNNTGRAGKDGLDALIKDLNNHFKLDYLNEQFIFIQRMVLDNDPDREYWIEKLSSTNHLSDIFSMVSVALLCIYEDDITQDILSKLQAGLQDADIIYLEHINQMKKYFDRKNDYPNKNNLKVVLILLPVESKSKIVTKILEKIYYMQNI